MGSNALEKASVPTTLEHCRQRAVGSSARQGRHQIPMSPGTTGPLPATSCDAPTLRVHTIPRRTATEGAMHKTHLGSGMLPRRTRLLSTDRGLARWSRCVSRRELSPSEHAPPGGSSTTSTISALTTTGHSLQRSIATWTHCAQAGLVAEELRAGLLVLEDLPPDRGGRDSCRRTHQLGVDDG